MPSFATPFLKDGLVNEPWYRYLFQLQLRTGGSAGTNFATQDEFDALTSIVTAQGKEIDAEGVFAPFNPSNLLQRIETYAVPIVKTADQKGAEVVYAPPYSYDTVAQAIARYAAPPAIGNTTPSSGAFTTLSATSTVSGAGFTALFASPPSIGNTTANSGAFTTITASSTITPSQTAGIVGTTTNNNANAGSVGELLSNTTTGTNLPNNTSTNATSVSLTAGDWDVSGVIGFNPAGTTVLSNVQVGITTTSATIPTTLGTRTVEGTPKTAGASGVYVSPIVRMSLSATTTVYLVAFAGVATSTATVDGFIRARRVR
jgi:hypothetical protein